MAYDFLAEITLLLAEAPRVVRLIFWLTLGLAGFILLLLVLVLWLRLGTLYRARGRRHFCARWRPIIYDWMAGKPGTLPKLRARDEVAMLELWLSVREHVTGPVTRMLNRLAVELRLDEIAAELLLRPTPIPYTRDLSIQLVAVRVAKAMGTDTAHHALILASRSNNMLVAIAAVAGLVESDPETAEPCVLATLVRFDRWAPYIALRISKAGGSGLLHLVGPHLRHLPPDKVRNLICLAELSDDRSLVPLLRERLETTTDDREKAVLLRALARLGSHAERAVVLPLLDDPNWILRVQSVNALARLGVESDVTRLKILLTDPKWWVRFRAAQAILTLLKRDPRRLRALIETIDNDRARAVLEHVLAEQGPGT